MDARLMDDPVMLRVHVRAAEGRIQQLVNFVRSLSKTTEYNSHATGFEDMISNHWKHDAKALICMERDCCSTPGNQTPDGRGFCGVHASVMD